MATRRRRTVLIVIGSLLGSLIALLLLAYVAIDPVVRWKARSFLQESLGAPVRIRSVRVLLAGGIRVDELTVLSPGGFREKEAFHLESLEAVTRASAVLNNPIVVSELTLRQPEFIVDFGEKETNWAPLIRNAARQIRRGDETPGDPPLGFILYSVKILQPVLRIAPTKLFPDGLLIRLNDVSLDRVGNLPDSPSPLYLVVAALIQAVITGDTSDGGPIPSMIRSRLAGEIEEGGRAFTEALRPKE